MTTNPPREDEPVAKCPTCLGPADREEVRCDNCFGERRIWDEDDEITCPRCFGTGYTIHYAHPPAKADDAELVEAVAVWRKAFTASECDWIRGLFKNEEAAAAVIQADRKAVRDAAVGEVVAMRQALVSLQDHAERTEALFKTRLGERTKPTWFAVNALQDFVGFVRMWSECDKARAAIASGEHEGAGE